MLTAVNEVIPLSCMTQEIMNRKVFFFHVCLAFKDIFKMTEIENKHITSTSGLWYSEDVHQGAEDTSVLPHGDEQASETGKG